jgi:hypothetical protein
MSGDAKLSPSTFRRIGRFFEILTMGSFGVGLFLLSNRPWYVFLAVIWTLLFGVAAYYCARRTQPEKSNASLGKKLSEINERYSINVRNLEKMTADGVPWDVVGALAKLIDRQPSLSANPTGMTEVELIRQLVSLECDLERINEFRKKILKNTKIENTVVPSSSSNGIPSGSGPASPAQTLEAADAVDV